MPVERPNILFIVADDMAYTDIGAFGGGDIQTPTLDTLADEGIRFSRFYAGAQCSTTRAMLMTGVDNHRAGLGTTVGAYSQPAANQLGKPGYEGELRSDVITLSTILQNAGYYNVMVGKWHLGASKDNKPSSRGFDQTFAMQQNSDHFDDQLGSFGFGHRDYWRNGEIVEKLPKGFFSSRNFTTEFIKYLDQRDKAKPFFGYLAYTAPHYPLQAPEDIIDKYQGHYDAGYDDLRSKRIKGLQASGLINKEAKHSLFRSDVRAWNTLSDKEKQRSARSMEIYAAMVDDMDQNISRVLAYLKSKNLYHNTLIIFLSDNGAEAASAQRGHAPALLPKARNLDNSLENMGRRGSVVLYSHTWAAAGNGIFREYKFSGAEGGVRVPAVISWPAGGLAPRINHGVTSVLDIMPTVLELARVEHPTQTHANAVYQAPIGKSLVHVLMNDTDSIRSESEYLGFEFWGGRGVVAGDWKLTGLYDQDTETMQAWQLFNLATDPGEQRDLAKEQPVVMKQMLSYWQDYVTNNGVILAEPNVPALRKPQKTFLESTVK
ncbi:arylsulfatase [Colwellia chukchiensis]|nr:arylsulfatase [Colwellia chukchiensis]